MLVNLNILNFVVVEQLELDFFSGMTVLTGETGAGKSIIIDALTIVLGGRAESRLIRHGKPRAEVSACFNYDNKSNIYQWLIDSDLHDNEHHNECIIRRIIVKNGRSRAYINNRPVNVNILQQFGNLLIDIHGQHEHQSLLNKDHHLFLIDAYCQHTKPLATMKKKFMLWQNNIKKLNDIQSKTKEQNSRLEFLQYQLNELKGLNLLTNEYTDLSTELNLLAKSDDLIQFCDQAMTCLSDRENCAVISELDKLSNNFLPFITLNKELHGINELLNSAHIQINEVYSDIKRFSSQIDNNPERLTWIETRLAEIHHCAKKYHLMPEDIAKYIETLTAEYDSIQDLDSNIDTLKKEIHINYNEFIELANKISAHRKIAAEKFANKVIQIMHQLKMIGQFKVQINACKTPHSMGLEKIEFLVSNNPGQPLQPLSKVASGGELSRISLAIQVIAAEINIIPTLIFDEVDVGVGGAIAEIIGKKLAEISHNRQIICITHLAQVAAQGKHHLQVYKKVINEETHSHIIKLEKNQKINEIARMLGGIKITDHTLSHAQEMINNAQ